MLFTGVVDEAGERVLARLGGSMAKGVADMNYLVTDKVRRTVKFLCAVAKGVPIVTTQWLEKVRLLAVNNWPCTSVLCFKDVLRSSDFQSGKAGNFLSPTSFIVEDPEQEKKFNFCLQESLRVASNQPLLQVLIYRSYILISIIVYRIYYRMWQRDGDNMGSEA